jgi:hypothetical protein
VRDEYLDPGGVTEGSRACQRSVAAAKYLAKAPAGAAETTRGSGVQRTYRLKGKKGLALGLAHLRPNMRESLLFVPLLSVPRVRLSPAPHRLYVVRPGGNARLSARAEER